MVVTGGHVERLARTAMMALHHANATGTYTVLRDLMSREAQNAISAADLASKFAVLRAHRVDLSPVAAEPLGLTVRGARLPHFGGVPVVA